MKNTNYNFVNIPKDIHETHDIDVVKLYLYFMFRKCSIDEVYIPLIDIYSFWGVKTDKNKIDISTDIQNAIMKFDKFNYVDISGYTNCKLSLGSVLKVKYNDCAVLKTVTKSKYGYINFDEYNLIKKCSSSKKINELLSLVLYIRSNYSNNEPIGMYRYYTTISNDLNMSKYVLSENIKVLKNLKIIHIHTPSKKKKANTDSYYYNRPNIFVDCNKYKRGSYNDVSELVIDESYNSEMECKKIENMIVENECAEKGENNE